MTGPHSKIVSLRLQASFHGVQAQACLFVAGAPRRGPVGQPTQAAFSIAIGCWGEIQIEPCRADNDAPSIYSGEYAVRDRWHHVCVFVESIAEARRACAEAGAEVIIEGKVGDTGEVIYVDAGGGPGHLIELLQPMAGSEALFAMMRDAAQGWDGLEPLRRIG